MVTSSCLTDSRLNNFIIIYKTIFSKTRHFLYVQSGMSVIRLVQHIKLVKETH